jgi:hypothetical protein
VPLNSWQIPYSQHWVLKAIFGPLQTCASCYATECACLAQEAQVAAQLQLAAPIAANEPQVLPQPPPEIQHNPLPPIDPPALDPLSAISPEDEILLNNYWEKLMSITMELCDLCHEEWFDPGNDASHLPELTQMEEMLISPVHALVQLWQICDGQTKYTGHTCNFPHENAVFHAKVPLLPQFISLTLDKVVVELGDKDISAGLSIVAISSVKILKELAFHTCFDHTQLEKLKETETMLMLKKDTEHCNQLGSN